MLLFQRKTKKLENRLESLERELGAKWSGYFEEHTFSLDDGLGSVPDLWTRIKSTRKQVSEVHVRLSRLLAYLGLTETTYSEKTVIEKIKKGKK